MQIQLFKKERCGTLVLCWKLVKERHRDAAFENMQGTVAVLHKENHSPAALNNLNISLNLFR